MSTSKQHHELYDELDAEMQAGIDRFIENTEFSKQLRPLVGPAIFNALNDGIDRRTAVIAQLLVWLVQAVATLSRGDMAIQSFWLEMAMERVKTAEAAVELLVALEEKAQKTEASA